jgi:hypothetical protein
VERRPGEGVDAAHDPGHGVRPKAKRTALLLADLDVVEEVLSEETR